MTVNPLAVLFEGASDVQAEIARRQSSAAPRVDSPVERYHPDRIDLTVAEVIPETGTSATFRLRRPDGRDLPPFLAGQYINLYVTELGTSRPFAISSSPATLGWYDLTVRRVPGGRVSNHLIDRLAVGDRLHSTGPMGTFHHNPLFHGSDVVFLAGGSGVAPALSMVRDIVDNALPRRLHLIYGSRLADDIIFRTELDSLASHPGIQVDHVIGAPSPGWTGATGLLSGETITRLAGPLAGRMVYVCGPQIMYPYVLGELAGLGHPRRRIRFEANGAPSHPERQAGWPAGLDPDDKVLVSVQGGQSFRCSRNRPLLESLEENGVRPEVGCRSGECSLCRVRVVSGEVFTAAEARLRLSDTRSGYTHSCVAYPLTDVEIAV